MSEKHYVVITKQGINIADLDQELKTEEGSHTVPSRPVALLNAREKNDRMTEWLLTKEEAASLREDSRVEKVVEKSTGDGITENSYTSKVDKGHYWAVQSYDTAQYPNPMAQAPNSVLNTTEFDLRNAGLYLHSSRDDLNLDPLNNTNIKTKHANYQLSDGSTYNFGDVSSLGWLQTPAEVNGSDAYFYELDGEGIDWVMLDSGILVDHPEFTDKNGVSRVKAIDWYEETGIQGAMLDTAYTQTYASHGTHVASIACGKKHGWAKEAHIYCCSYNDLDMQENGNQISLLDDRRIAECLNLILAWHNQKTNGRPTVLNMSIGVRKQLKGAAAKGSYRGTAWDLHTFDGTIDTSLIVEDAPVLDHNGNHINYTNQNGYYNTPLEDLKDEIREDFKRTEWFTGVNFNFAHLSPSVRQGDSDNGEDATKAYMNGYKCQEFVVQNLITDGGTTADEINTLVGQLYDAGVHVVTAAGNDMQYSDVEHPDHVLDPLWKTAGNTIGQDWDNTVTSFYSQQTVNGQVKRSPRPSIDRDEYNNLLTETDANGDIILNESASSYYMRPPAPYDHRCLNVGSIGNNNHFNVSPQAKIASHFSNKGAAVNIWAYGQNVMAAGHWKPEGGIDLIESTYFYTGYEDDLTSNPEHFGYTKTAKTGTSMAAPQVSGIACLYLQQDSSLTPAGLRTKMLEEARPERLTWDEAADTYDNVNHASAEPWFRWAKYSPWEVYNDISFPNTTYIYHAGTTKVVKAPLSGKGSLTIQNNSSTADTEKMLSLASDCYLKYSSLVDTVINSAQLSMTLSLYEDASNTLAPLTGLKDLITVQRKEYVSGSLTSDVFLDINITDNTDGTYTFITTRLSTYNAYEYIVHINGKPLENMLIVGSHAVITSANTAPDLIDGTSAGQTVYTATSDQSGTVWHLETGLLDSASFSINPYSGVVTINGSPDYTTNQSYSFVVRATHTNGYKTYKTVSVNVIDLTAPVIIYNKTLAASTRTLGTGSVDIGVFENTAPAVLGEIVATDDSLPITLSLVGSIPSVFSFDTSNGQISLVGDLDYEGGTQSYSFVVRATDALGNADDYTVNINVLDVDEIPPTITSGDLGTTVEENVSYTGSDIFYTAVASETVTWSVLPDPFFQINTNTGAVTLHTPMDANHNSVESSADVNGNEYGWFYVLTVYATDTAGNTTNKQVRFDILKQYEGLLDMEASDATINIIGILSQNRDEFDFASGVDNLTLKCQQTRDGYTAGDLLPSSQILGWTLANFSHAGLFSINQFGQVLSNQPLDYETFGGSNLVFTVAPTLLGALNISRTYILTLNNTDDEAPVFTVPNNNIQYNAPLAANSTLLDVSTLVSDPDGSISNPFTYSITSTMSVGGYYSIDSSTGVITNGYTLSTVGSGVPITVKVTDAAGNHSSYTFTTEGLASSLHTATVTKGVFSQSNGSVNYYGFHYAGGNGSMTNGTFHNNAAIRFIGSFRYQSYTPTIRFNLAGGHSPTNSLFSTMTINVGGTDYTFNRSAAGYANYYGQETQFTWTSSTATAAHTAISGLSDGQTFTVEWD